VVSLNSKPLALLLIVLVLIVVCVTLTLPHGQAGAGRTETTAPEALDNFDEVVQQRFHNVIGFGMTRVATQRWFLPETKQEKDSVNALKKSGYEVCLYLVGRSILQDIPERLQRSEKYLGSLGLHLMSGPVFVGKSTLKRLPGDREMWEPARKALREFDDGATRHSFEAAGWTIEARPVRASNNQCLECHGYDMEFKFDANGPAYSFRPAAVRNKLGVGDPMGALLYVYRKKN
jgi:hypothetical protein